MAEEEDRSVEIHVPQLRKWFPAPDRYDDIDWADRSRYISELWARAPWFDSDALGMDWLMQRYVDEDGLLPGGIPLAALRTESWRRLYSVSDDDLFVPRGRTLLGVRCDFTDSLRTSIDRLLTFDEIPSDQRMDLFV